MPSRQNLKHNQGNSSHSLLGILWSTQLDEAPPAYSPSSSVESPEGCYPLLQGGGPSCTTSGGMSIGPVDPFKT